MENSTGFSPQSVLKIRDNAITTATELTRRVNVITSHVETMDRLLAVQLGAASIDTMTALIAVSRSVNALMSEGQR